MSFGIDRDFIGDGGGNNGDYLEGGIVTATTTKNALRGIFTNNYGFGFTIADGFGLIDGQRAAQLVPDVWSAGKSAALVAAVYASSPSASRRR